MIRTKTIANWIMTLVGIAMVLSIDAYTLQLIVILIFGSITSENRKEINKAHKKHARLDYFHNLGKYTKISIILYLMIVTPGMIWIAFEQPGTINTLFSEKFGFIMLLGVFSPLLIPIMASVIKHDIELIKNGKNQI